MQNEQLHSMLPGSSKRKRMSTEDNTDIENVPVNDKKKLKEDKPLGEHSYALNEDRVPLTELSSLISLPTGKDGIDEDTSDRARYLIKRDSSPSSRGEHRDTDYYLPSDTQSSVSECCLETTSSTSLVSANFGSFRGTELWDYYNKESEGTIIFHSDQIFANHPNLLHRMRSVLLEWIIEVCDVYKLHRQTYYLALNYLDRYLSVTKDISKSQLQLIGVTCLLIAAKYEEIYPPKVVEFAYITDGACTEDEILSMELIVIKSLSWKCTIITPNSWLTALLQLLYQKDSDTPQNLMLPCYSIELFKKVAQLLDLVSLDENFLNFSYKVLAVSALYIICSESLVLGASGLEFSDISECVAWMEVFWDVLQEKFNYSKTNLSDTISEDSNSVDFSHNIITHSVSLELLEAGQNMLSLRSDNHSSSGLLTPPSSSSKTTLND